jgi:sigma-E factor negative regulatory protein RseC
MPYAFSSTEKKFQVIPGKKPSPENVMIEETGTVIELKGPSTAIVLCQKGSFCEQCAALDACRMGDDNTSMQVEAHNTVAAEVGDRVVLSVSSKTFLTSSFVVYIVPIIFLLIGGLIGQYIGETVITDLPAQLLSALFGVSFLVGAFLTIRVGSRALKREYYLPRIVRILRDD